MNFKLFNPVFLIAKYSVNKSAFIPKKRKSQTFKNWKLASPEIRLPDETEGRSRDIFINFYIKGIIDLIYRISSLGFEGTSACRN